MTFEKGRVQCLPAHVSEWIDEHEDVLWKIYLDSTETAIRLAPAILDKADFTSFAACMARLSRVDSPSSSVTGKTFRPCVTNILLNSQQAITIDKRHGSVMIDSTEAVEEGETEDEEIADDDVLSFPH